MNFTDLLKATEARFRDRAAVRADNQAKLDSGLLLQADSPGRVEQRLKRLGVEPAAAKLLAGSDLSTMPPTGQIDPQELNTLERIIHKSDLMSVNFFDRGAHAARSIGRIRIRTATGSPAGFGTGFLVSPRLLLTNNHVLPDAETASFSQIEFNYQDGLNGDRLQSIPFDLEPDTLFLTSQRLDFSLVAVRQTDRANAPLASFGWHPLIAQEGKVIVGEYVTIIQHPNGEPKQVALRENQLIDVLPDFLHYQTDTAPGASGSPVFNDQWEVVALHHSGVPKRDDRGRILNLNGEPWTPEQGEQRVAWLANEGVRISRIIQYVKTQTAVPVTHPLLTELLGGTVPPTTPDRSTESVPQAVTTGDTTLTASEDGTMTWTIPLQVSVRLGQPVAAVAAPVPSVKSAPGILSVPDIEADLEAALTELKSAAKREYYDQASDHKDRDAYYQKLLRGVDDLSARQLYQELSRLVSQTHTTKASYQPSRHLYPWVDLHPDRTLRSIYTEQTYEPEDFIRADFQVERLRAVRSQELRLKESLTEAQFAQELDLLEASLPYNCEHVVPQSWFGKKEPMRGDLHHLFACEVRCNSFRGNTPFFEFDDFGEAIQDNCGKSAGTKFEPNAGKGAAARATLYFLLRYPGEINKTEREYQESRLQTLLDWHKSEPVSEYEQHRNAAIFEKQGNRNPLIDFPEWAEKIAFRSGLG